MYLLQAREENLFKELGMLIEYLHSSVRSMEVKLTTFLGNYDRQTRQTEYPTDGQTGSQGRLTSNKKLMNSEQGIMVAQGAY